MDKNKKLMNILFRYLILLIIGLIVSFTSIFYRLLLPLTIHPINFLLNIPYTSVVSKAFILVESFDLAIELIPACIAVSAYLLLLILNLTTSMKVKTRIYSILFSMLLLLALNILRIFILAVLLIEGSTSFEIIHKVSWYALSIVLVVGAWFLTVWLFKIKEIPIHSDFKTILSAIKHR